MFLRENFARTIFARRNISARVHSHDKMCVLYLHLVLILKNAEIATSAVFCKNLEFDWFRFFISPVRHTGAEQFFWLQRSKFQCACPELIPLANFALCAEKNGRGICPLRKQTSCQASLIAPYRRDLLPSVRSICYDCLERTSCKNWTVSIFLFLILYI